MVATCLCEWTPVHNRINQLEAQGNCGTVLPFPAWQAIESCTLADLCIAQFKRLYFQLLNGRYSAPNMMSGQQTTMAITVPWCLSSPFKKIVIQDGPDGW